MREGLEAVWKHLETEIKDKATWADERATARPYPWESASRSTNIGAYPLRSQPSKAPQHGEQNMEEDFLKMGLALGIKTSARGLQSLAALSPTSLGDVANADKDSSGLGKAANDIMHSSPHDDPAQIIGNSNHHTSTDEGNAVQKSPPDETRCIIFDDFGRYIGSTFNPRSTRLFDGMFLEAAMTLHGDSTPRPGDHVMAESLRKNGVAGRKQAVDMLHKAAVRKGKQPAVNDDDMNTSSPFSPSK